MPLIGTSVKILLYGKVLTLSQTANLDSFKLKEFADNNFKFYENGRKFYKWVGDTVTSNFSFSHSVFKRLVLQYEKTRACLVKA